MEKINRLKNKRKRAKKYTIFLSLVIMFFLFVVTSYSAPIENTAPVIINVTSNGPVDEGSDLEVYIDATDAEENPLTYEVNVTSFVQDVVDPTKFVWTTAPGDAGFYTLGIRVLDAEFNAVDLIVVEVNDITPPVISDPTPNTNLPAGTTRVNISVVTDENARCHYDTDPDQTYFEMSNIFNVTDTQSHTSEIIGLEDGKTYTYYIKCKDFPAPHNYNTVDKKLEFTVDWGPEGPPPPDTTSPVILDVYPQGDLVSGTTEVEIRVITDETSYCHYDLRPDIHYLDQQLRFDTNLSKNHTTTITGLVEGESYKYYIKCRDIADIDSTINYNELDTPLEFNVNSAPELNAIGDKDVYYNYELLFTVLGTDADDDSLIYSTSTLPDGATFDTDTFSWTPNSSQAGTHEITFSVSDGVDTDSETITITLSEKPTPKSPGGGSGFTSLATTIVLNDTEKEEEEPKDEGISKTFNYDKKKVVGNEGDKFSFMFKAQKHSITIDDYIGNFATLTVASTPTTKTIRIGSSETFDLDDDNEDDLYIYFESIENNEGVFSVNLIKKEVVQEAPPEEKKVTLITEEYTGKVNSESGGDAISGNVIAETSSRTTKIGIGVLAFLVIVFVGIYYGIKK